MLELPLEVGGLSRAGAGLARGEMGRSQALRWGGGSGYRAKADRNRSVVH